jgi:hypothetical protein
VIDSMGSYGRRPKDRERPVKPLWRSDGRVSYAAFSA